MRVGHGKQDCFSSPCELDPPAKQDCFSLSRLNFIFLDGVQLSFSEWSKIFGEDLDPLLLEGVERQ
jgi:hypothetical protein